MGLLCSDKKSAWEGETDEQLELAERQDTPPSLCWGPCETVKAEVSVRASTLLILSPKDGLLDIKAEIYWQIFLEDPPPPAPLPPSPFTWTKYLKLKSESVH